MVQIALIFFFLLSFWIKLEDLTRRYIKKKKHNDNLTILIQLSYLPFIDLFFLITYIYLTMSSPFINLTYQVKKINAILWGTNLFWAL